MTTTRAVPPPLADLGVRWAELEAQKNAIAAQQADIVLAAARAHVEGNHSGRRSLILRCVGA